MRVLTKIKPILGKHGEFNAWQQIPNIRGVHDPETRRLLSVSPKATLELTYDTGEKSLLVFPIGRYIRITATQDNRNNLVWATLYNEKDLKKDSEHPESNPDEDLV